MYWLIVVAIYETTTQAFVNYPLRIYYFGYLSLFFLPVLFLLFSYRKHWVITIYFNIWTWKLSNSVNIGRKYQIICKYCPKHYQMLYLKCSSDFCKVHIDLTLEHSRDSSLLSDHLVKWQLSQSLERFVNETWEREPRVLFWERQHWFSTWLRELETLIVVELYFPALFMPSQGLSCQDS